MKSIAIGIGSYGISVITTMANSNSFESVIAIDSDRNMLNGLSIEQKIFVSKRLPACDAVERIKNKLKKLISDTDIVFVISNPIDIQSPYVIPYIVDYIKSLEVVVVALVIDPHGKYDRERKKAAKHIVDFIVSQTATIKIPQKYISLYDNVNYDWYEYSVLQYRARDKVYEQVEFDRWYKQHLKQYLTDNKSILVGIFYLHRIIELLNAEYPLVSREEIRCVMATPGILHCSSTNSLYVDVSNSYITEEISKRDFIRIIRDRAMFNEIIQTSSHGSEGLIFVLTVPTNMPKEEVAEIAYMLHTFSLENTHSVFTINTIASNVQEVSVKLIATGADDMDKDNY